MKSFEAIAGSSHYLIAGIGFNLTSEIGLVTALRLCNPQLFDIAIGRCVQSLYEDACQRRFLLCCEETRLFLQFVKKCAHVVNIIA